MEMDLSTVRQLAEECRNWGRWGDDDEIGTLNYVTAERVARAASLVRRGDVFSLAVPLDAAISQRAAGRFDPVHTMIMSGTDAVAGAQAHLSVMRYADDLIATPTHCATHWDALSHVFDGDRMYMGRAAALVSTRGAGRNGIDRTRERIIGRGVLLDIARDRGVGFLEPGEPIGEADLERCCRNQSVQVERGDFLLVRTGHIGRARSLGTWEGFAGGPAPGLSLLTARWLHRLEVAAVAADTWAVEVIPNETPDVFNPWHIVVIPAMGLLVGETFDLDALAADCARDGVYEFLLAAPALVLPGAVGSPVNPLAVK